VEAPPVEAPVERMSVHWERRSSPGVTFDSGVAHLASVTLGGGRA
jgi:hypothetical protein